MNRGRHASLRRVLQLRERLGGLRYAPTLAQLGISEKAARAATSSDGRGYPFGWSERAMADRIAHLLADEKRSTPLSAEQANVVTEVRVIRRPSDDTFRFFTGESCRCPAQPGEDCPLTADECETRHRAVPPPEET